MSTYHARIQKIHQGGPDFFFRCQHISQRAEPTSLDLGPKGSNLGPVASQGGSVPVFLRKHIATCDFPGGGGADPLSTPLLDPPMLIKANTVKPV